MFDFLSVAALRAGTKSSRGRRQGRGGRGQGKWLRIVPGVVGHSRVHNGTESDPKIH